MKNSGVFIRSLFLASLTVVLAMAAFAQPSNVQISDQKAGALLVFPFYGSDGAGGDTRLTITNVGVPDDGFRFIGLGTAKGVSNNVNVHLFFLDASCNQADVYLCFSKYQSYSFKASEWDPVTSRGELLAVVVDKDGNPISYNGLIGNAFVNTTVGGAKWVGNYSPEAFSSWGIANMNGDFLTDPANAGNNSPFANLLLTNAPALGQVGYDSAASSFAVEFQSPVDVKNQAILTMGLNGIIGGPLNGNAARGIGTIYRNDEKLFSFTPPGGGCSVLTLITDASIRIVGGLSSSISTGKTGTAIWSVAGTQVVRQINLPAGAGSAVGLFITPQQANSAFSGIRTLHKRDAGFGVLQIPVFMPICL